MAKQVISPMTFASIHSVFRGGERGNPGLRDDSSVSNFSMPTLGPSRRALTAWELASRAILRYEECERG